ncbi:hypothetical protein HY844_01630 [Candidatus Berkelbacteria bacterium]|nr:hypothetical protein [Candidatus Berkelbacteria bacterium]
MKGKLTLSPSFVIPAILTDNKTQFVERLNFAETIGAVHIDVINNDFCSGSSLPIDDWPNINVSYSEAHLMVKEPIGYLEKLATKGVRRAIVHVESDFDLIELRNTARMHDILLGYAIKPETDLFTCKQFLEPNSYILIMGVNPGASAQEQLPQTNSAVSYVKQSTMSRITVSVDGGVNTQTIKLNRNALADFVVASSAIFNQLNPTEAFNRLAGENDER